MSSPPREAPCRVTGAAKLPAATGGSEALCGAIKAAARRRAVESAFSVEVRVISSSALEAVVRMADGRVLPSQNMAVSDARLDRSALDRFAEAIADQVARERVR